MKIIATDFDGTLNHGGIDDAKKSAISLWRQKGNLFGVISGRGKNSLLEVIGDKGFEYDFLVANNGALIMDSEMKIIKEFRCDGVIARPFIKDLFSWGCPFGNIDSYSSFMVVNENLPLREGEMRLENIPGIEYFNQINTMLSTDEEAAIVVEKIKKKYSSILNPLQNGNCIDITPKGVDKAQGIYALLEVFGGKSEDVITVGDNINDEAMIREFTSYAMANGVQYIKDIANYTTTGITELIHRELKMTSDD